MTLNEIKAYALSIGIDMSDEDCKEIIYTSYEGETVKDAVHDFLDAFEGASFTRWLAKEEA